MSYWRGEGLYQATLDRLNRLKEKAFKEADEIPEKWWLLDAATGLYYGLHNDGDNASGAAENNRIWKTFKTLGAMKQALPAKELPKTFKYLNDKRSSEVEQDYKILQDEADDMMDEIALYYDRTYNSRIGSLCWACDNVATCAWETAPSPRLGIKH
jgi:hypothetical protein